MKPLTEVYKIQETHMICLSAFDDSADKGKDILIKNHIDIDDPMEQFENPLDMFDDPTKSLIGF